MALLLSCKEEISTNQKYIGIYDGYDKFWGIPGQDANGDFPPGLGRVALRTANKQEVSVTVYENVGRTREFPRCEILPIDTTGNIYQYYARVIEKTNNKEIAKIRQGYLGSASQREERIRIDLDITVEQNRNIFYYAVKRRD
ncbi:hypothetical protein [Emticicia fontis]